MVAGFVPDASVILKWVLPEENEPHASKARTLRDSYISGECALVLPALWLFEVGNIITRKFPDHAQAILDALCALDIPIRQDDAAWRMQTIQLATRYAVTFHDASYHATAIATNGVLVSADAQYLRCAQAAGHSCFIGEWVQP